jgi:hypothetical protein
VSCSRHSIVVAIALALACTTRTVSAADAGDCPTSVPTADATCATPVTCEYGGNAFAMCTTLAICNAYYLTWQLYPPDPGCGINSASCPVTFDSLKSGVLCPLADAGDICIYGEGACGCPLGCVLEAGGGAWEWQCRSWSNPPGCPTPRPLMHTACDTDGQVCISDGCCGAVMVGYDEICKDGVWQLTGNGGCACPPPAQCSFDVADAGSDAGGGDAVGAEPPGDGEDVGLVGCGCNLTASGVAAPAGGLLVFVLGWRRRRRRPR